MQLSSFARVITDRKFRFMFLSSKGFYDRLSDEKYIKAAFYARVGYALNLDNVNTFNEKLQWLKLNDRRAEYAAMVDKYDAKRIVADRIGETYVIPTLGVWNTFDDIDFDKLPSQFVLKCTHDSGGLIICRDKDSLDIPTAKEKITKSLQRNFYLHNREWPYKNVKPRIIAEKYMQDGDNPVLNVFKVFNFNNGRQIVQVIQGDKTQNERIDYYDDAWNHLDLHQNFKCSDTPLSRPATFSTMLELGRILSDGFPFLRTDFYEINGKVFFSEFTFYSDGGFEKFHPDCWDEELGNRINLPY